LRSLLPCAASPTAIISTEKAIFFCFQ
jgi:hypothetical protein